MEAGSVQHQNPPPSINVSSHSAVKMDRHGARGIGIVTMSWVALETLFLTHDFKLKEKSNLPFL